MLKDEEIKVLFMGGIAGKTSIINRLIGRQDPTYTTPTMLPSLFSKNISIDNKNYILNLWDIPSQEKFPSTTKYIVKDANMIIFVYNIASRESFNNMDFWVSRVKNYFKDDIICCIIGNMNDLYFTKKVEDQIVKNYAEERNMAFYLTSTKCENNCNSILLDLTNQYISKKNIGNQIDGIKNKKNILNNNSIDKKYFSLSLDKYINF